MGRRRGPKFWVAAGLKIAFFLVFAWFYTGRFVGALSQLEKPPSIDSLWLGLSVALSVLAYLGFPAALFSLAGGLSRRQAATVYLLSSPAKYVPGKIWPTVVFTALSQRFGLGLGEALGLVFWLNLGVLVSGLAIGSWTLHPLLSLLVFTALATLHLLSPFRSYLSKNHRLQQVLATFPGRSAFVGAVLWQAAYWVLQGVASCCLLRGMGFAVSLEQVPQLVGGFAASALLGILAPFAPGGLGVREVALSHFLTSFLPPVEAALAPAFLRILQMVVEGSGLVVGLYLLKRRNEDSQVRF